jgi:RND family efflux transporter MFP subunit
VKTVIAVITLLTMVLGAACGAPPHEPEAEEGPAVAVAIERAEVADLVSAHEAGGIVRARSTATIASRVLAPVAAVHVRPGDRVRRGAALVTLDAREHDANAARAAAGLASAVEAARAADADIRAAESSLQLARATHQRIAALFEKRSATPQERDQALAGVSAAEAQLTSAQARAAAAAAAREAARAASEAATIGASYSAIAAPFDAVVTERLVDPGSMATPGTPLLMIEDQAAFRLEVQLDEARAARLAPGQPADVRLDSVSADEGWTTSRVVEIARVEPSSHSFLVKVELPGGPSLRSGLFGRARFAGTPRRALTIPASALIRRGQLTFVFIVDEGGRARLRPVSVAGADGRVEVLAGVTDGERVIVGPPEALTDGRRVEERR